jgi:uncharacterized protein YciI
MTTPNDQVFAVIYRYSDDNERRSSHRPEHRTFLRDLLDRGRLIVSGPFTDSPGALLIVRAASHAEVEATLDADPFMRLGCITERTINEFNPTLGQLG